MKLTQTFADKLAISLSLLCAIHCLAMPFIVLLGPAITGLVIADESFHLWLVLAVLPVSAYALTMGCKKHRQYQPVILGAVGLLILVFAAIAGHDFLGEVWEKGLTLLGALIIAAGHVLNFRKCQRYDGCDV